MQISDLTAAFDAASPLSLKDILLNAPELELMNKCLRHCILRIIVKHGGEKFGNFRKALDAALPVTPEKIELHQTPLHPLPAWNIDQATIVANAEVADAIYSELEVKGLSHWKWAMKPGILDSVGVFGCRDSFTADMHGFFVTLWGVPHCGTRNPGSLSFHNTHLHRSPIVLASLPPFRVCLDLVFTSLYSRILHRLLLVSGKSSLDECTNSIETYEQLEALAALIQSKYANASLVSDLRWQREMAKTAEGAVPPGDEIFENACLFIRDGLISRGFTDSIKAGDSGRIVLVLKLLALSFRGNGRTKYAYEMLHIIHNLTHVWPKPIRLLPSTTSTRLRDVFFAEGDGSPTPDMTSVGIQQLADSSSNPFVEYNAVFRKLQARRRLRPLVNSWGESDPEEAASLGAVLTSLSQTDAPMPDGRSDFTGPQTSMAAPAPTGVALPDTPDVELVAAAESVGSDDGSSDGSEGDDASADGLDNSGLTVFECTMEEVEEPTLTRESAADVALDMDRGDDKFLFSKEIYDNDGDSDSDGYMMINSGFAGTSEREPEENNCISVATCLAGPPKTVTKDPSRFAT
ncbi:hypothetical protein B0H17DRAFT_1129823 [Mycena rosella]|uniref:DUF6589 domain-containing protein n=1 Tax=Mycena rosella TaxID=1033263 RepID=A0AAD7DRU7_MYCRO|nr:hypothetical protein B0H17DRAFT_1129823 [Mycena rosella]